MLVFDGVGMWLCTRRLQAGSFEWPRQDAGSLSLTREQFDWLVAGLPWLRLLSLIESAKLHCHDPLAYLKDVFERLPTLKNRALELLLPHNWWPAKTDAKSAASAAVPATLAHSLAK